LGKLISTLPLPDILLRLILKTEGHAIIRTALKYLLIDVLKREADTCFTKKTELKKRADTHLILGVPLAQ